MHNFSSIAVRLLPTVVGAALAACLPIILSEYQTSVATQVLFAVIGGYSVWLMMRINLLSLGHATFLGIGAYVSAILTESYEWPFWASLPLACAGSVVAALAFGVLTLRLQGIYFAMMSFVLLELFHGALREWPDLTGGTSGLAGVPRPEDIDFLGLHVGFQSTQSIYWLSLALAAITMGSAVILTASEFGLRLRSIAASERLAESAGVSVFHHRLFILAVSAAVLGLCGPLAVSFTRLASPSNFELGVAIDWLVYAAVGARFGTYGPAGVAIVLLTLTEIVFTQLGVYRVILYGLILIATVVMQPLSPLRLPRPARPAKPAEKDGGVAYAGTQSASSRLEKP